MRTGYIYVIINKINGKYYFGKTFYIKGRWNKHLFNARNKINRYLYDAMNHYGYENFSIHKINEYFAENKSKLTKILNEKEIYFISLTESNNPKYGYNMSPGGDGGYLGEEAIKKMADKKRGVPLSEEHKRKISEGNKGIIKPVSKETRRKISETNKKKGIKWKPQYWGKKGYIDHPMLGKHHSKETRKKMSKSRKGRSWEDIYGEEKAKELKQIKSERWKGNEINFKEVNLDLAKNLLMNGTNFREVAKKLNISETTFNYKFRKKYGLTPYQYQKKNYEKIN